MAQRQHTPPTTSFPSYRTDTAAEDHVSGILRAEKKPAATLDLLTFYKTCLGTNVPLLGDQDKFESDDDGYPCLSEAAAAHDTPVDDAQPQARGHTAAYKFTARLANRSNGAPLATIVEQGSYSTLNSHGSMLSVGRFPSVKAAENTTPNRGSRRRSHSVDGKALHDIQEDLAREHDVSTVAVPHTRLGEEHEETDPASGTATPLTSYRFELKQSPLSRSGDELFDHDSRGVKRFIRGVLQNVQGGSRTRSRSSSMTHVPIIKYRESPTSTCQSSSHLNQQGQGFEITHIPKYNRTVSSRASEGAAIPPTPGDQSTSRAISSGVKISARVQPLFTKLRPGVTEPTTVLGSIPPVLSYRAATRSHERPFSTPVVRPGTHDVAPESDVAQASMSRHDTFDISARYTFNGVPAYPGHPSSLREASSARQVFTSQNASFCSTMTSSYSGTVLGVDLDLQHDFSRPIRRSQSPPTPVWFTPQMAELERQATSSEPPESVKTSVATYAPCRSITSSALTSLLPIAAASGIVRPNYNTTKISFYSPSGNLIQLESSLPQGTSLSEGECSSTTTTSYYNRRATNAASSSGSLPIRPPLVPMTTPPTHKTPLPSYLRHYDHYHYPEMSQISSCESSSITPKGPVKGCDGVVRENSLIPRNGIFHPNGKDDIHRSIRLIMHDLKAEAKLYKAHFLALVTAQSFAPSIPKGRTLQKCHVHNYNTCARKPQSSDAGARKGRYGEDVLGPLAAHALRVCFCQPYDGAGKPTLATAAGACMAGEPFSKSGKSNADQVAKEVERSLPNARVVGSKRRSKGGDTKKATRGDSAVGSTARRASSTGMARRKVH